MAVGIAIQPNDGSFNAAYRPILFRVNVTNLPGVWTVLPPIVYADVYINNVYYKTISKTQPRIPVNFGGVWIGIYDIDIQDALQEYLRSTLPDLVSNQVQINNSSVCQVFVRFRNGYIDANGITQQDGGIPQQATEHTPPIGAGGVQSNTFNVTNSTLQHEANQDLAAHYEFYTPFYLFGNNYRCTHQPAKKSICKGHYDWIPVMHTTIPITSSFGQIFYGVTYVLKDGTTGSSAVVGQPIVTSDYDALYLPSGYKQAQALFPLLPWDAIAEYTIFYGNPFYDLGSQAYKVICCDPELNVQLTFLNYLGTFDTISFCSKEEFYSASSESWEKPLFYANYFLEKNDGGVQRLNVKGNEKIVVTTHCYSDQNREWIKEIIDTPRAYILLPQYENQEDALIPYVISDVSDYRMVKKKERYCYEYSFTLTPANQTIRQRN